MKKITLLLSIFFATGTVSTLSSQDVESTTDSSNIVENEDSISTAESTETKENEIIQAAYDVAFKKIIQDSAADLSIEDRVIRKQLDELPLFPVEEKIAEFPTPIGNIETNPETLAEYYATVGEAYFDRAKQLAEDYARTEVQLARAKQDSGVENFRTQDQKLNTTQTITPNKNYLFGYKAPPKSEKYFHAGIKQRAKSQYAQHALIQKKEMETAAIKGSFYMMMALSLLPNGLSDEQE